MQPSSILHVLTSPTSAAEAAALFHATGITLQQVKLLDITLGKHKRRKFDLVLLLIGDFTDENLDTAGRLRQLFDQPMLVVVPAYHESYMERVYEVGVDECFPATVGSKLAAAKVRAWMNMVRRMRERRGHGVTAREKAEVARAENLHEQDR